MYKRQASTQPAPGNSGASKDLELILRKGKFSFGRDFSVRQRDRLIRQTAASIQQAGGVFHAEMVVNFQDDAKKALYAEVNGPMGLYASVGYVSPTSGQKAAIKVSVPFRDTGGLDSLDSTEIVRIVEELETLGYRRA